MRIRIIAAIAILCVVSTTYALAQTSNATVGGTVADASGALIPGVSVTATNTGTGIVVTSITNEAGAYNFPSLQTGAYRVSAELPGFQTQTYNEVALGGAQQVRLNFTLQVGSVAQAVEVTVSADTLIATTSASVGTVLPEYRVRELPLGGRNVMDLLATTGGTGPSENLLDGNFAGGRLSAVNTTRDGFVVSDGRFNSGAFSMTYVSPDLVEEVRIITAPVDAEAGRGAGQVQMVTRSGTNQFRGSLFWQNRNSALDAANWFTNFNRAKKDYENRNNWGGRLGGPIVKNKTFFFVLVEGQRDTIRQDFVGNVLTGPARQGIFRFFPGADNQNTISLRPTVDSKGNPVRPASATGDLQQFSVFNRDAFRPGYDPTGFIQNQFLARMPVANDFTIGDGLNTAGHRFTRRMYGLDIVDGQGGDQTNRDQFNTRIDHNFNSNNKFSVVYTEERNIGGSLQAGVMEWPGGYDGASNRWPRLLSTSLVSTLSPSVINELRVGYKRVHQANWTPYYVGRDSEDDSTLTAKAKEAFALLPKINGIPFVPISAIYPQNFMNWVVGAGAPRWHISPQSTFADTISWNMGSHSFKAGAELRRMSSSSGGDTNQTPRANLGAGGVPVQNIDNIAIPGLSGNSQTLARTLLTELSGSVDRILEGYDLRDSKNPVFLNWGEGAKLKLRGWYASEFAWFLKDSWKTSPNVTLNYGVHWEWFGVPYEKRGLAGSPVGGSAGLCGISCGSLSTVEFVGKNSPNPGKKLYNNDLNNFAPSFGLSWNVPWLGKDKTVLRAGYGWSFTGGSLKQTSTYVNFVSGGLPGTFGGFSNTGWTYTQAGYLSLGNLSLPIPKQFAPLAASPLDGSRQDSIMAYDNNRQDPYIQNVNFELQREMGKGWTLSVAYVGTKGTRLWAGIPLNPVNINAALPGGQTFLNAFNVTRSGGDAPLFDQMLRGMNIPGAGVVNGTTLTGSAALRAFVSTRAVIANGNVAGLADFLNRSTAVTGKGGGFVRNSGLFPENFFVLNPQFNEVTLHSNPSNSTYHSTQIQATKRLSQGFTNQITYTLGRALGETDNDFISLTPRDPSNRSLDKALLAFHRTHNITTNGTFELPFGPNRAFLSGAPGFVQRLVERWQLGAIFNWTSGAPLSINAPVSTVTQIATNMTPNIVGDFPKSSGKVTKVANGVTLFPGILQINDPSIAGVSSTNALNGSFTNKAITDSQGNLLLTNPVPGQIGTLGLRWVQGPTRLGFDANLIKRVRITETREFEFRLDALNILNHPNFDPVTAANLNINSTSFGRLTTATGSRRFIVNARLNF